jgi:hypothetical protein
MSADCACWKWWRACEVSAGGSGGSVLPAGGDKKYATCVLEVLAGIRWCALCAVEVVPNVLEVLEACALCYSVCLKPWRVRALF